MQSLTTFHLSRVRGSLSDGSEFSLRIKKNNKVVQSRRLIVGLKGLPFKNTSETHQSTDELF